MRKGYIQVYTGDGKGKTTAALGLALRAAGAGLKVFIAQFVKQRRCSEHEMLERFQGLITVRQYGRGFILKRKPKPSDVRAAQEGLGDLISIMKSASFDVVILDEANVAAHYNLLTVNDLLYLMELKPKKTELVITGRYADEKIIQRADLVTEMREIKHYKDKGIKARRGIEK
ncbi:MAG TPA: cob(I)yrinic acid a,c-diamide adenosyltransferase [Thermodesulfovibrionales bacterium]|nr:cob(I)yrinic acid a,c-diamide adenosyltransferase [Thermodesulfovibrionales bacterium]